MKKSLKKLLLVIAGIFPVVLYGEETKSAEPVIFTNVVFWILLGFILFLFLVFLFLAKTYRDLFPEYFVAQKTQKQEGWIKLKKAVVSHVPIEEEKTILLDHNYDGIQELDNNLPLWWRYMFYLTIVFCVIYLFRFHILKSAPLQMQEYSNELALADIQKKEFLKKSAEFVNEENVNILPDQVSINAGKEIFLNNCAACHGRGGEGGVGPNLTDDYWIHGGGIKNIFKTVNNGVPDKGMISWKTQLKPSDIQKVSSFIMTMKGTNPPNPKAPQGEIYNVPDAVPDSSAAK